jgi:uncharacterized protein (UPF0332 family)
MEGKDFLTIALQYCGSSSEAERRTAVSRAYYALFNTIKYLLRAKGFPIRKSANGHDQLYRYLNNSGLTDAQAIASKLNSLRTVRNDADYELHKSGFDVNNCTLYCRQAEKSFERFDSLNIEQLSKDIETYKKKINER